MLARLPFIAALLALTIGLAGEAWAGKPVALVLDVVGDSEPLIEPFGELQAGDAFELGAGTRVEFMHYPTCDEVVVEGGRLSLSEQRYTIGAGRVVEVRRGSCPEEVELGTDTDVGGVTLRGAGGELRVNPTPTFVFVGDGAGAIERVQLLLDGAVLREASVSDNRSDWSDEAPLEKGTYSLVLFTTDAEPREISIRVKGRARKGRLTLVRLD